MISFLDGVHGGMENDGAITVVVNGVGYRVIVSDRDREGINKRGIGGRLSVFCRTVARENDIVVYGFTTNDDRRAFDKVIQVDGVGVATAMRILSLMDAHKLKHTIDGKDPKALCHIPGIGSKTAEKIIAKVRL